MKRKSGEISLNLGEMVELNLVLFTYKFLNTVLRLLAAVVYSKPEEPGRILIFRTGSLGDSLCAIPVIAGIRKKYPASNIDILINPGKAKATLVSIDQLLSPLLYNNAINYFGLSTRQIISLLRKNRYDLIVQLPQGDAPFLALVRDIFFYRFIAKSGWGWEQSKVLFFRKVQEKTIEHDREVVRLAKIATRNHVTVNINEFPLNSSEGDIRIVEDIFEQLNISDRKIIGIVIGAKRPQNRWPLKYFREVIDYFVDDYNIIIVGGEEDRENALSLCTSKHVFNVCGSFSPMQSAVAFTKCSLVLSNDTGPMHLSYSVGTPTVAVFSSRDFKGAWYPPENARNIVFRSENIPCALCLSDDCRNNICMQAIVPSEVIGAMCRLINNTSTF